MNTVPARLFFACLLLIGLVGVVHTSEASPESASETSLPTRVHSERPVTIEAFVRQGCPHCEEAKSFLGELAQKRPALHIRISDVQNDTSALERLERLAEINHGMAVRVPAFGIGNRLIVGYSREAATDRLIIDYLDDKPTRQPDPSQSAASCEAESTLICKPEPEPATQPAPPENFEIDFLGNKISLADVGLPAFTVAMGLLDGFNPCSMWVLLLMISLLAPMGNRWRMLAIAGVFVAVEGLAYFIFMAAWLNLFLLIGLSRLSEILIALIAFLAGSLNLKDFWAFGLGPSLSIPKSAKPGIYVRIRNILQADNLTGAIIGVVVLAVLVQIVEFLCTSGFPALFTRILTLQQLEGSTYYGYLLLYNLAYMLDDIIILGIGVVTLSQHRLQEREGRWLKLISGMVMIGLAAYLLFRTG